ncbi:S4A5 electrogenic sodium bicarbonate cotransporter 4 [Adlercreutzia mucosicola]|uniref:S4A5 electrogenic sodium bicarbonate cotransporter 4 n=1 Tax=Adlercreutzia mucosicola TaxID=580026 RepID=UPI002B24F5DA|nr:S4A5 electrogenic sodium bicarbonate cotransporter 4 [Adlercreutzia mucosicola]MEB1813404.1 S4A5 electrogenic sodium bicarbonate cotransporter 4 [Adlercreutzia mucosicola]
MARPHGSVRIGPISLFTLIIILCLAVLAVLSITTARAELSITERQAATTTETYQLEVQGQEFVAAVDGALASGGETALEAVLAEYGIAVTAAPAGDAAAAGAVPAGEAIEDETPSGGTVPAAGTTISDDDGGAGAITVSGTFDGELISATFAMDSGRTLAVVLRVSNNDTYTIEQWKTTTQWTDDGAGENLWLG